MRLKGVDKTTFWGFFFFLLLCRWVIIRYCTLHSQSALFETSCIRCLFIPKWVHVRPLGVFNVKTKLEQKIKQNKSTVFRKNCISGQDLSSFDCLFYRSLPAWRKLFITLLYRIFPEFLLLPQVKYCLQFFRLFHHICRWMAFKWVNVVATPGPAHEPCGCTTAWIIWHPISKNRFSGGERNVNCKRCSGILFSCSAHIHSQIL